MDGSQRVRTMRPLMPHDRVPRPAGGLGEVWMFDSQPRRRSAFLGPLRRLIAWTGLFLLILGSGAPEAEAGKVRVGFETVVDATGKARLVAKLSLIVYFEERLPVPDMEKFCPVFDEVSRLLYNATEGQMRLAKVTMGSDPSFASRADIIVSNDTKFTNLRGKSASNAWNTRGLSIFLVREVHGCMGHTADDGPEYRRCNGSIVNGTGINGPFGILHELGHYLFGLKDEYEGKAFILCKPGHEADCTNADKRDCLLRGRELGVEYFCSHQSRATDAAGVVSTNPNVSACIMDGSATASGRNRRTEFCNHEKPENPASHQGGVDFDGCEHWTLTYGNRQEILRGMSCWEWIVQSDFVTQKFPELKQATDPPSHDPVDVVPGQSTCRVLAPRTTKPAAPGVTYVTIPPPSVSITDARPAFILAVDTSGSMGDSIDLNDPDSPTKMELVQTGALNAVDFMKDGEALGILDMNEREAGDPDLLPMEDVSESLLATARTKVGELAPLAKTALGDALRRAKSMLDARTDADSSGKFIIVLSDGRNTAGVEDPIDVLIDIINETRTTIFTIAIGPQADRYTLSLLAEQTGGSMFVIDDATKLTSLLPRVFDIARGDAESFDVTYRVAAGGTTPADPILFPDGSDPTPSRVTLSAFDENTTFLISFEKAASFSLELLDPTGNKYLAALQGGVLVAARDPAGGGARQFPLPSDVLYRENPSQILFRVAGPEAGVWQISARNDGGSTASVTVLVSNERTRVSADAIIPYGGRVTYPAPILIQVPVRADGPVAGVDVTAVVSHPRGAASQVITLYDDGLLEHGDEEAGDGFYAALFSDYKSKGAGGGDGAYRFSVTVKNTDGVLVEGDDGSGGDPGPPIPVAAFTVYSEATAVVSGMPDTLSEGAIAVSTKQSTQIKSIQAADLNVTPALKFRLRASEDEYVRLDSLRVTAASASDATLIDMVGLYRSDAAGTPFTPLAPLAYGTFSHISGNDYQVTFADEDGHALAMLPADVSQDFVITIGRPRTTSALPGALLAKSGSQDERTLPPWLLLLSAGLLLLALAPARGEGRLSRRAALAAALAAAILLTGAVGCGGGGTPDPETGGGGGGGGGGTVTATGFFTLTLDDADVSGVGIISGDPVDANGGPLTGIIDIRP